MIWVLYVLFIIVASLVGGVDYDEIAASTDNAIKAIVVPIGVGAAALVAAAYYLGWWHRVFRDDVRSPRWTLLVPAFMAIAIVVALATADWEGKSTSLIAWLFIGTIFVGIAEETLNRGLVLTAFRGGMGEVGAWFWSSSLFGLMHGVNIITGQDVGPTLRQIVFAFVFGGVLYATRRATGTLLVAIVLHAMWDFSTFMAGDTDVSAVSGLQGIAGFLAVATFVVAALKRSIFLPPYGDEVKENAEPSTPSP